tara:strand:- start:225 stop:1088 length:864 start_codon:yes stop_codon:yes gene_type:complete
MNFSIIIPTYSNFEYLKFCINSIIKNSKFNHEIIVHINGHDETTENYLKSNNFIYTQSDQNIGLCSGVNKAVKKSTTEYVVYAHDDMYFLPDWDTHLIKEIELMSDNLFFLSSIQLSHYQAGKDVINHIYYNGGKTIDEFNEHKILDEFKKLEFYDLQGSHWAPHVMHKSIWNRVGGFSEEYDPGFGSDPDLNMKLWKIGVRIFKGVNKSRVYHFGSLTTRKNLNIQRNNGRKTFLLKWKISIDYFVKYYLRRGEKYNNKLTSPKFSLFSLIELVICKFKYFYLRIF